MFALSGRSLTNCEGLSRRSLLRIGALGLGGLSLADVLRLRADAATSASGSSSMPRTSVIFFEMAGGPTHFETYDPKPQAPIEYRGPLDSIDTVLPGVQFSELMVEQAKIADKLAVIRSIHHDNSSHGTSSHLTQTGYYLRNNQNRENEMPSFGSIAARVHGPNSPGMPSYVSLPRATRYGTATWLGKSYNPFVVDGDPNQSDFRVNNLSVEGDLSLGRIGNRRQLLDSLDAQKRMLDNDGVSAAFDSFTRQAFEMLTSDQARQAFDLSQESESTRDQYGRNTTGQSLLLARRLVEAGVTFVTVRLNDSWDDHTNIAQRMQAKGPNFDRGIAALVRDIYARGLDEQVLVVSMGEFGRTPRVNRSGGRDHWGSLMSIMLSGGGLKVGQIVGASSPKGEVPQDNPYRPENVLATIYRHLGIDPAMTFNDLTGRPRFVLERRELVRELV